MREIFQKPFSFCNFLDLFSRSCFANTKKLDVTTHPVMTCNDTIILGISFEQSSFALKLFLLRLIASLPLIIDAAYAHITTTSVSFESISTGVV